MAVNCRINTSNIPKKPGDYNIVNVLAENGEMSLLFLALNKLGFVRDEKEALELYAYTQTPDFKRRFKNLVVDKNNEPLLHYQSLTPKSKTAVNPITENLKESYEQDVDHAGVMVGFITKSGKFKEFVTSYRQGKLNTPLGFIQDLINRNILSPEKGPVFKDQPAPTEQPLVEPTTQPQVGAVQPGTIVETAKGSTYTYLPDGKTQRFKKVEDKEYQPQDLLVFLPDYKRIKSMNPSWLEKQGLENEAQYTQYILRQVQGKDKVWIVDSKGNKIETNENANKADRLFMAFGKEDGSVQDMIPVSKEPVIGFHTYDSRLYSEKGKRMRERHLGNKVVKITQPTTQPQAGAVQPGTIPSQERMGFFSAILERLKGNFGGTRVYTARQDMIDYLTKIGTGGISPLFQTTATIKRDNAQQAFRIAQSIADRKREQLKKIYGDNFLDSYVDVIPYDNGKTQEVVVDIPQNLIDRKDVRDNLKNLLREEINRGISREMLEDLGYTDLQPLILTNGIIYGFATPEGDIYIDTELEDTRVVDIDIERTDIIPSVEQEIQDSGISMEEAVRRNNGNPMSQTPFGKESKLYLDILALPEINGDVAKADMYKAQLYSDNFRNWFGDWLTNVNIESENLAKRIAKYKTQNKIMEDKMKSFINNKGIEQAQTELRQIGTPEANAVADLIEVELANIRAKQFDRRTEEGRAKSKEQYDIKNNILESLFSQYQENGWDVRYEKSNIPGIAHTLFFTIPNTDIQLSYHGNYEGIADEIVSLPEGQWDKIPGATFHKLEEASANLLGEQIEDTNWREGIDLGFDFTQAEALDNVSKVVDENGEPRLMYHGSVTQFEEFDPEKLGETTKTSISKMGFFFAGRKEGADQYIFVSSLTREGPLTESKPYFLSFRKPYLMSSEEWRQYIDWGSLERQTYKTKEEAESAALDFKQQLIEQGFDGIIVEEGDSEVIAFEPTQIKSVFNTGAFSPTDARIQFAAEPLKQISVGPKGIDRSTDFAEPHAIGDFFGMTYVEWDKEARDIYKSRRPNYRIFYKDGTSSLAFSPYEFTLHNEKSFEFTEEEPIKYRENTGVKLIKGAIAEFSYRNKHKKTPTSKDIQSILQEYIDYRQKEVDAQKALEEHEELIKDIVPGITLTSKQYQEVLKRIDEFEWGIVDGMTEEEIQQRREWMDSEEFELILDQFALQREGQGGKPRPQDEEIRRILEEQDSGVINYSLLHKMGKEVEGFKSTFEKWKKLSDAWMETGEAYDHYMLGSLTNVKQVQRTLDLLRKNGLNIEVGETRESEIIEKYVSLDNMNLANLNFRIPKQVIESIGRDKELLDKILTTIKNTKQRTLEIFNLNVITEGIKTEEDVIDAMKYSWDVKTISDLLYLYHEDRASAERKIAEVTGEITERKYGFQFDSFYAIREMSLDLFKHGLDGVIKYSYDPSKIEFDDKEYRRYEIIVPDSKYINELLESEGRTERLINKQVDKNLDMIDSMDMSGLSNLTKRALNRYKDIANQPIKPTSPQFAADPLRRTVRPSRFQIKPGVKKLFESNPELANQVYEELQFGYTLTDDTEKGIKLDMRRPIITLRGVVIDGNTRLRTGKDVKELKIDSFQDLKKNIRRLRSIKSKQVYRLVDLYDSIKNKTVNRDYWALYSYKWGDPKDEESQWAEGMGQFDIPSKEQYTDEELFDNLVRQIHKDAPRLGRVVTPTQEEQAQIIYSRFLQRKSKTIDSEFNIEEFREFLKQNQVAQFTSDLFAKPQSFENTAIHEFGHLWGRWAKKNRNDLYRRGLDLTNGSEYLKQVQANPFYANKTLEEQQDEALMRAIGDQGEQFINEQKRNSFKDWLNQLWEAVKNALGITDYTAEQVQNLNLNEFARAVAIDLLKEDRTFDVIEPQFETGIQPSIVGIEGAKRLDTLGFEVELLIDLETEGVKVGIMRSLEIAKMMDNDNVDSKQIKLATMWEKDLAGDWFFELNDLALGYKITDRLTYMINNRLFGKKIKAKEAIDYPTLFDAYPDLENYTVQLKEGIGYGAQIDLENKEINILKSSRSIEYIDLFNKIKNEMELAISFTESKLSQAERFEYQQSLNDASLLYNYMKKIKSRGETFNQDKAIKEVFAGDTRRYNRFVNTIDPFQKKYRETDEKLMMVATLHTRAGNEKFIDRQLQMALKTKTSISQSLLHELTHFVQEEEGFESGAGAVPYTHMTDEDIRQLMGSLYMKIALVDDMIKTHKRENIELSSNLKIINEDPDSFENIFKSIEKFYKKSIAADNKEFRTVFRHSMTAAHVAFNKVVSDVMQYLPDYDSIKDIADKLDTPIENKEEFERIINTPLEQTIGIYKRVMGELQAEAVAERKGFTEKQRRTMLFSETSKRLSELYAKQRPELFTLDESQITGLYIEYNILNRLATKNEIVNTLIESGDITKHCKL